MKKFNQMTERQMTKANGGIAVAALAGPVIFLGLATATGVGAGVASKQK